MAGFLSKLLTFGEGKQMKRYQAAVDAINALEPSMQALSDDELRALTPRFRERLEAGEALDEGGIRRVKRMLARGVTADEIVEAFVA